MIQNEATQAKQPKNDNDENGRKHGQLHLQHHKCDIWRGKRKCILLISNVYYRVDTATMVLGNF